MTSRTLSDLTVDLLKITQDLAETNLKQKTQKAEKAEIEEGIKAAFKEMGNDTTSIRTKAGTISLNSTTVATVEDWEAFHQWVYENQAGHMLERRVANVAFREMNDLGEEIPGLKPFDKITVSLTKK